MAKKTKKHKRSEAITSSSSEDFRDMQKATLNIKSKADAKRTTPDKLVDRGNAFFGSNLFLYLNFAFFTIWVVINSNLIPAIKPFDPFPFTFFSSIVSLEAIVLAIFVLISQNRAARIADLRAEVQLQINTLTEDGNTRMMQMLVLLLQKNNIPIPKDKDMENLLRKTDTEKIEKNIEKQLNNF